MDTKKKYQEKIEATLKDISSRVDELKTIVEHGKGDVKAKYREQLDNLKTKQDAAKKRLKEIKEAGEGKWESMRDGMEHTLADLKKTFDNTVARFKR